MIRNYEIERKFKVTPPEMVEGILSCPNSMCISNTKREPIKSRFYIKFEEKGLTAKCHYCGRKISDLAKYIG